MMPQCVFKHCKNSHRDSKFLEGLSFFRFPSNPFLCEKWVSIVAKERGEDIYKPSRYSKICSIHFESEDLKGNTHRRRLLKTAIPKFQISSAPKEVLLSATIKEELSEDTTSTQNFPAPIQIILPIAFKEELSEDTTSTQISPAPKEVLLSTTFKEELSEDTTSTQAYASTTAEDTTQQQILPQVNASSRGNLKLDLMSMQKTPREVYLINKIVKYRKILKTKSGKINNLTKVNKRLKNKVISLKKIINILKKGHSKR